MRKAKNEIGDEKLRNPAIFSRIRILSHLCGEQEDSFVGGG